VAPLDFRLCRLRNYTGDESVTSQMHCGSGAPYRGIRQDFLYRRRENAGTSGTRRAIPRRGSAKGTPFLVLRPAVYTGADPSRLRCPTAAAAEGRVQPLLSSARPLH
jgi:hypothetical protein